MVSTGDSRHPLRSWTGPERRYDLLFEGTIAVIVVAALCVGAAILWGSPDAGLNYPGGPPSRAGQAFSARYWDGNDPADLAQTAVMELQATTVTATYGPPFNTTPGGAQELIGIQPAVIAKDLFGLTQPINTAGNFVLTPVSQLVAPLRPVVGLAVRRYEAAGGDLAPGAPAAAVASPTQQTWLANYLKALQGPHAHVTPSSARVPAGNYGPVPVIIDAELLAASDGGLDGYFQGSDLQLRTDMSEGTMFFSDGDLWGNIAEAQGVGGDQWGVMNEVWNFPGQVWLWLYAGMYQIPWLNPANNANLDLDVGLLMVIFGFLLPMFAPWIPGVNRIPRWIPFYRIIYRRHYGIATATATWAATAAATATSAAGAHAPADPDATAGPAPPGPPAPSGERGEPDRAGLGDPGDRGNAD